MARGYQPFDVAKPFGPDTWIVDGPEIRFMGLPFSTRMTIVRLTDGRLWLHSPIRWSEACDREVLGLGEIAHLIAPNWIHYAYVDEWHERFGAAEVWASPGVMDRARAKGIAFPQAASLEEVNPWAGEIETLFVKGSRVHRECVFFHHASRTLILTDIIENFETEKLPEWFGFLTRLMGVVHPDGKMPFDMAQTFRRGRQELRRAVETMIGWGPERIILAHGKCYETGGTDELNRAFRKLLGPS